MTFKEVFDNITAGERTPLVGVCGDAVSSLSRTVPIPAGQEQSAALVCQGS